jgi:uncharacterized protein YndB with AHSA1/START domain
MSRAKHLPGRTAAAEIGTSAAPQDIWDALVTPEGIARWFVDRAEGRADREGHIVKWFFDRFQYELPYRVLEAVPGERLALDGGPEAPVPFLLEITIRKQGGHSLVSLVNSGFLDAPEWDDRFEGVVSGWQLALATLKESLERHGGRDRVQFFSMLPAVFEYAALEPFYRDAGALAQWLTRSGEVGAAGAPCRLVLQTGDTVTGLVLARSSREVLIRWDEIGGVLALKAFELGKGTRALCVHGSSWRMDGPRAAALEKGMTAALGRLRDALPGAG